MGKNRDELVYQGGWVRGKVSRKSKRDLGERRKRMRKGAEASD